MSANTPVDWMRLDEDLRDIQYRLTVLNWAVTPQGMDFGSDFWNGYQDLFLIEIQRLREFRESLEASLKPPKQSASKEVSPNSLGSAEHAE